MIDPTRMIELETRAFYIAMYMVVMVCVVALVYYRSVKKRKDVE